MNGLRALEKAETPGSENIISSAGKRVDLGVYNMIQALVDGDMDAFVGGGNYILNLENDGVGLTDSHEYDWPEGVAERIDEIVEMLINGDITTGVDPVSGDLEMMDEEMDPGCHRRSGWLRFNPYENEDSLIV